MDFEGKPFKLKLYPPLRNVAKGVHIAKGKSILEYRVKVNALSKPRINHPSFTLALKGVQTYKHKRNKDKTLPLEICNEDFKELLVFHKKTIHETWKPTSETNSKNGHDTGTLRFAITYSLGKFTTQWSCITPWLCEFATL
jgi:hypothetical protein